MSENHLIEVSKRLICNQAFFILIQVKFKFFLSDFKKLVKWKHRVGKTEPTFLLELAFVLNLRKYNFFWKSNLWASLILDLCQDWV